MIDYFAGCANIEQIRKRYHALAFEWHPDRKPPSEKAEATRRMQDINAAYKRACRGDFEQQKPHATEEQKTEADSVAEAIRLAILAILNRRGLGIELCGAWVWVTGTHKRGADPYNDETLDVLMQAGYKFASKKQMWYFAGVPSKGRGASMEHIRSTYGSHTIKQEDQ